jgi:hypothetical protein
LSKEASTAFHRFSHWVGPTCSIPKAIWPEHFSASHNASMSSVKIHFHN